MEELVSPRKAIQDWLAHTEWTCSKDSVGPSGDATPYLSDRHDADDSRGLAAKLDLLPPFRHMDKQKHNSGLDSPQRRKRKRDSSSLHLKPAGHPSPVNDDLEANLHSCNGDVDDDYTTSSSQDHVESPPRTLSSSSIVIEEPPTKSYRRRPRHRTKETRYDLKDGRKSKAKDKRPSKKKQKKQKKREKTAGAILHNFSATNVAQERLTLRPSAKVGLFSKGRASSSYRRRGLPDVSFSEVKFLTTHRDKPEIETLEGNKRRGRRKNKTLDDEEQLSRFFAPKKPLRLKAPQSPCKVYRNVPGNVYHSLLRKRHQVPSTSFSSVTLAELPGRPFLGFGKRGPSSASAREQPSIIQSTSSADNQRAYRSRSPALSHVSWSESPKTPRSKLRHYKSFSPNDRKECVGDAQDKPRSRRKEVQSDLEADRNLRPQAQQMLSAVREHSLAEELTTIGTKPVAHSPKASPIEVTDKEIGLATRTETSQLICTPEVLRKGGTALDGPQAPEQKSPKNQASFQRELHVLLHKWKDDMPVEGGVSRFVDSLDTPANETRRKDSLTDQQSSVEKPDTDVLLAQGRQVRQPDVVTAERAVSSVAEPTRCSAPSADSSVEASSCSSIHRRSLTMSPLPPTQASESNIEYTDPHPSLELFHRLPSQPCTHTTWAGPDALYERQIQTKPDYPRQDHVPSRTTALSFSPHLLWRTPGRHLLTPRTWTAASNTTTPRGFAAPPRENYSWLARERTDWNPDAPISPSITFHNTDTCLGSIHGTEINGDSIGNDTHDSMTESTSYACGIIPQSSWKSRQECFSDTILERDGDFDAVGHDRSVVGNADWGSRGSMVELDVAHPESSFWTDKRSWRAGEEGDDGGGDEAEEPMTDFWQANMLY